MDFSDQPGQELRENDPAKCNKCVEGLSKQRDSNFTLEKSLMQVDEGYSRLDEGMPR
jgi:hypothetical protein